MTRDEIAAAIQSNRLEEVQKATMALRQDPNMWLRDRGSWTVTPIFLAVDQECTTAEEREQNFAIVTYLLGIPGLKIAIHRKEDNFPCLGAAVYQDKVAVISKLLTHLRYVEFKGDRGGFLNELNHKVAGWQGGGTALSWAILQYRPSIARLLIAVDPDNIDISDEDISRAEADEKGLDYLVGDLKRTRREQEKRKSDRRSILRVYHEAKRNFSFYNLWSERAAQFLAFATGLLSLLGVFIAGIPVEPTQIVLASVVSVITWYLSRAKDTAEESRSKAVYSLITENGFFDEPNEIDKALERQAYQERAARLQQEPEEKALIKLKQAAAAKGYQLVPKEPDA